MITAQGVSLQLGGRQILDQVGFSLNSGECSVLLGPNGAGKSTLLRCLVGLQRFDVGKIILTGQRSRERVTVSGENWDTRAWPRADLGFVPQLSQLVATSSVMTNVIHGFAGNTQTLRCCFQSLAPQWMREKAMQQIEEVGLAGKEMQQASSLSGGEAQRCAIARSLVGNPSVVIADEPTASLDANTRKDIQRLLRTIADSRNCTVLVTTHLLDEATEHYHRAIGLRNGKLVLDQQVASLSDEDVASIFGEAADR